MSFKYLKEFFMTLASVNVKVFGRTYTLTVLLLIGLSVTFYSQDVTWKHNFEKMNTAIFLIATLI